MPSTLAVELKQSRPFASLEQEAFLSLARTEAVLAHAFADALKPHGITPTQYNVLRILRGAGRAGLCRNEVTERLVAQVPDATRLLARMEKLKLVERTRDATDRRMVNTRITRDGLAVLAKLDSPTRAMHHKQLGHLGPAKLRTLITLLALARLAPAP